jgi:hypothetical protein
MGCYRGTPLFSFGEARDLELTKKNSPLKKGEMIIEKNFPFSPLCLDSQKRNVAASRGLARSGA